MNSHKVRASRSDSNAAKSSKAAVFETPKSEINQAAVETKVQNFLRRKEVEKITGLKCSSIYEKMKDGTFPRPINISKRLVVWLEADIAAWQAAQIAANKNSAAQSNQK